MKKGWQVRRLGEILEIQNGFAFDSKLFNSEKGMPLIRIRDLKNGIETETKFSGTYDKRYEVHAGDFLIGMDGEFGCYEWKGSVALLNQRVCRLQNFSKELFPRFLLYRINDYLKAIEDVTAYATVKHISSRQIENIEIPIPPLPEQQRIVSVLDEAFTSITQAKSNAERNLVNARELFDAVLQNLVSNDEWEKKTLKEISITFGRGKSKNRPRGDPKLYGGKYPFIQTGDISNSNHWITTYSQTYNELGLAQSKLWTKGTICIAIVGANVGETAILGFDACFPDSVIGIIVNDKTTSNEYVEYLLQTFKTAFKVMGKGTARDNINMGMFENRKFPFPPLAEQRAIVGRLEALSAETGRLEEIYEQKVESLEELKKSVLGKAFEGEL